MTSRSSDMGLMIHMSGLDKIAGVIPTRVASLAGVVALVALTAGVGSPDPAHASSGSSGIKKIKHVVVIMQETRSSDSYFGTYPKADGIPMKGGKPSPCIPNAKTGKCDKPFADHADVNGGGPHGQTNATADVNGGENGGLVQQGDHPPPRRAPPTQPPRVGDQ